MKLAEPRTLGLVLVAWGVIGFFAVAGIVAVLWKVAGDELEAMFRRAMGNVSG